MTGWGVGRAVEEALDVVRSISGGCRGYVLDRARAFVADTAEDPRMAPRGDLGNRVLLLAAAGSGFATGYGMAVDSGRRELGAPAGRDGGGDGSGGSGGVALPRLPGLSTWNLVLRQAPEMSGIQKARARAFFDDMADAAEPVRYYATYGFAMGSIAGGEDLDSGAARYFSEVSDADVEAGRSAAEAAARASLLRYSEDAYAISGGGGAAGGDGAVEELLALALPDVERFVAERSGALSGRGEMGDDERSRWASAYSDHYMLGLVEHLLGMDDDIGDLGPARLPEGDRDAVEQGISGLLRYSGIDGERDLELAMMHAELTWDIWRGRGPGALDMYYQVAGFAYVEGVHAARELPDGLRGRVLSAMSAGRFDSLRFPEPGASMRSGDHDELVSEGRP